MINYNNMVDQSLMFMIVMIQQNSHDSIDKNERKAEEKEKQIVSGLQINNEIYNFSNSINNINNTDNQNGLLILLKYSWSLKQS